MSKHTGKCACGSIKYEFDGEPAAKVRRALNISFSLRAHQVSLQALCHCLNCQHRSGSAFTTNILVPRVNFQITSGTPKHWTFQQNESGLHFKTTFCGDCGTLICKENDEADDFKPVLILQLGTADEGLGLGGEPSAEFFIPHRAKWQPELKAAQCQGFA